MAPARASTAATMTPGYGLIGSSSLSPRAQDVGADKHDALVAHLKSLIDETAGAAQRIRSSVDLTEKGKIRDFRDLATGAYGRLLDTARHAVSDYMSRFATAAERIGAGNRISASEAKMQSRDKFEPYLLDQLDRVALARRELLSVKNGEQLNAILNDAYGLRDVQADMYVVFAADHLPRFLRRRIETLAGVNLDHLRARLRERMNPEEHAMMTTVRELAAQVVYNIRAARSGIEHALGLSGFEDLQQRIDEALKPLDEALRLHDHKPQQARVLRN